MTITLPLRLMTLHFSQIGFTDGFTFILLPFLLATKNCLFKGDAETLYQIIKKNASFFDLVKITKHSFVKKLY